MSTRVEAVEKLLRIMAGRGLSVVMTPNGPAVRGDHDRTRMTPDLRDALKLLRDDIIEHLGGLPKPVKTIAWVEWSDDKDHAMPLKDWQRMEDDGVLMNYFDWRLPKGTKVVHLPEGESHPAWRNPW